MKTFLTGYVVAMVALGASAATNDLDIARAALRDGLWNVARSHAHKVNDDTAKLIVLESYAREENWKGLLAAYDAMGYPAGEGFSYYRAAALFKEGSAAAASNVLASAVITNANFSRSTARLRAELALAAGNDKDAVAILEKNCPDDVEAKLMVASIRSRENRAVADRLWREVAADTNASERARAAAAAGLRDANLLREVLASAQSAGLRRFAALKLGTLLIADAKTFAEGDKLIRETVRDKPDADGAREAFLALAEARLARGEFNEAEKTYADALQIWPDAVKDASLREGRGWALLKLGSHGRALEEFRSAEELATDPESKAVAAMKAADALAASGRAKESADALQKIIHAYSNTAVAAHLATEVRFRETEERGKALYRAYKFDEACKAFENLAKEHPPRREQLTLYAALCTYGVGDDEKAVALMRTLSDGAADTTVRTEATLWLAKFAFNRSRWREAEQLFGSFVRQSPKSPDAPQALVWSARAALADNDFQSAISNAAKLVSAYPDSSACVAGLLAQGEALIELGRFDEAGLVLDRAALVKGASDAERQAVRILRADALFAMGADNPVRYAAALDAYRAIQTGETLSPSAEIAVSFKVAKALEKLKRLDEAIDTYYTQVVLAYRTGRLAGTHYDESARATFVRAAFRLADEYESRGGIRQAIHALDLVRTSDVQAAGEAANRIDKLTMKGMAQ